MQPRVWNTEDFAQQEFRQFWYFSDVVKGMGYTYMIEYPEINESHEFSYT